MIEVSTQCDYILVKSTYDLPEHYLSRTAKDLYHYKMYWHFITDFNEMYAGKYSYDDTFLPYLRARIDQVNAYKHSLNAPINIEDYSRLLKNPYRQYDFQAKAVRFVVDRKRLLLADDVGLGKGMIGLTAMLWLIEHCEKRKFLVVVPASLRLQWKSECAKFINKKMFPDLQILVGDGTTKERDYLYRNFSSSSDPVIIITSYDMIRRDIDKIKKVKLDMVILDEASKIKTRTTKTNKAVRKLFKDTEYRLAMTATPIENGLEDLYSICEWIDSELFHTKEYFMGRYCIVERQRLWAKHIDIFKVIGYRNISDAKTKLAGAYLRRTVDDVELQLPSIITQNIALEMSPKQRNVYDQVCGKIYSDITREDLLAQMIFLQEICDSAQLISSSCDESPKLEEIKRLLYDDLRYQKVVIVSRFKKFVDIMESELKSIEPMVITGDVKMELRQSYIQSFNENPMKRVLIGTEAIEEGLNLQVASVLINADLPFNPARLQQRIGRIHRIGSTHKTVRMINLIMKDSMEQRVLDILYDKGQLFEKMFKKDEQVKIQNLLSMDKATMLSVIKG